MRQNLSNLRKGTLVSILLATFCPAAFGQSRADPTGTDFFEKRIRPVLTQQCYRCHSQGAEKLKAKLYLDSRAGMLKGGDSGPAIVPGHPEKSLLIQAIQYGNKDMQMPPKERLADAAVADLVRWVQMGAPWPAGLPAKSSKPGLHDYLGKDYETIRREHWAWQPVKAAPAPAVKNADWPKSDIDRFLLAAMQQQDLHPVADADRVTLLRRLSFDLTGLPPTPEEVDAFLADKSSTAIETVVDRLLASPRFGERWGRHWLDVARYAESTGSARNVPYSYAWRYRDYVIDAFNKDKPYDRFVTEQVAGDLMPYDSVAKHNEELIATGFLAIGVKDLNEKDQRKYEMDNVDEQIDVMSRAVMGLTISCARCHDHKFDPIPTSDYYAIAGIFKSTEILAGIHARRGGAGKDYASPNLLLKLDTPRGDPAIGVRDERSPANARICIHGEVDALGSEVPRGMIGLVRFPGIPSISAAHSGRLELAQWLASPKNPMTSRVIVNRIWQHLFGEGLVRTVDNFGTTGEAPSHPELLDYLASRFVRDGWSVKRMIRTIVLTRAYQLGATYDTANAAIDPADRMIWRMAPRRLEAEALRDAMLVAAGRIDLTPPSGSPVMNLPVAQIGGKKPGNGGGRGAGFVASSTHRSVYLPVVRSLVPEVLDVFDFAEPSMVTGSRDVTTVATQALYLMNNPFVITQAKALAARVASGTAADDATRVDLLYRLSLSRPATAAERERGVEYVSSYAGMQGGSDKARQEAWASLCQAVFEGAEFRYVR